MRPARDRGADRGRPFAVNHTNRPFREEAFDATLRIRPRAISFHRAVEPQLIAQGGEAGGHAGEIATMVLVPEVVDVAGDVPVVAAGGIADGRGLAGPLLIEAVREGRGHEDLPFAGQSVALVHEVLPAAEIVRRLVEDAEAALARAAAARTEV